MSIKSTVGFAVATGAAFGLGMHAARAATVVVSDDPDAAKKRKIRAFLDK